MPAKRKLWKHFLPTAVAALCVAAAGIGFGTAPPAQAAGEQVNIWLTTTNDAAGQNVTRGLQQQTPVSFGPSGGSANQTITVNENTTYQSFEGGGASFADSSSWLLNSSNTISAATRNQVMKDLFDPVDGIGLAFVRNPMGASDLARFNYSYDGTCCDLNDFSIQHDLADVVPLTKQARQLNPALKVMGSPWSAPAWMKDNNDFVHRGWLKWQYAPTYAQYFVKYLQQNEAQGNHIDYISVQNEPTCCGNDNTGYASMNWNGSGLLEFTKNNLLPALHAAGLTTKVLILDYNWGNYNDLGSVPIADAALRNDPNFGGIAWHGYGGDVNLQTQVHNQYPNVNAYMTEHSGGTWIANPAGRGHEQPDRLHPQLGQVVGQVGHRAGREPSAVRRSRLQRLHRTRHRAPQRQPARPGHQDRRVLHDGSPDEVREAGRVADRLDREQFGEERRVEEPRRIEGADRLQHHRQLAIRAGELGLAVVRLHLAHQDVRDLHLVRLAERRRRWWGSDHRPGGQVHGRGRRQQHGRYGGPALRLQRYCGPAVEPPW